MGFGGVERGGGRGYGPGSPLEPPWPGNRRETSLWSLMEHYASSLGSLNSLKPLDLGVKQLGVPS